MCDHRVYFLLVGMPKGTLFHSIFLASELQTFIGDSFSLWYRIQFLKVMKPPFTCAECLVQRVDPRSVVLTTYLGLGP
jgi:hypothetical protein